MDFDSRLLSDSISRLPDIKRLKIDRNKDIAELCTDAIGTVIPIIPLIKTSVNSYAHYKERKFAKRCIIFLSSLSDVDMTQEKLNDFIKELYKHTQEDGYDTIVGMIDRLDNENKALILSKLVRHCAEKELGVAEFLRVVNALERTPFSDLKGLSKYVQDFYEAGESEILAASGLIIQTNIRPGVWNNGNDGGFKYGLSKVGENMLRYGFESSESKYQGEGIDIGMRPISDSVIEDIINGTYSNS